MNANLELPIVPNSAPIFQEVTIVAATRVSVFNKIDLLVTVCIISTHLLSWPSLSFYFSYIRIESE